MIGVCPGFKYWTAFEMTPIEWRDMTGDAACSSNKRGDGEIARFDSLVPLSWCAWKADHDRLILSELLRNNVVINEKLILQDKYLL